MVVVLDLRCVGHGKTHAGEHVDDLVGDQRQGVQTTHRAGLGGQDTFYLSDEFLLRTQTSGGQIRTMDSQKPHSKQLTSTSTLGSVKGK